MSDWWDQQAAEPAVDWLAPTTATEPPAATAPKRPRQLKAPAAATIPFVDAWVLFRWSDEAEAATDVRVVRGSWLNDAFRGRGPLSGEPRDWTHDLPGHTWGETPQEAWRGFVGAWLPATGPLIEQAAEAWSVIEGLEHLRTLATYARGERAA